MRGLPPLLIQCGDAEVLRDEITLLAHKASLAGVAVRHELYEDCVHVFQAFLFLDASRKALQSCRHFVRTALDKRGKRRAEVKGKTKEDMDREMRQGMENERGEEVEPRTGEIKGSWRAERSAESDSEAAPANSSTNPSSSLTAKPAEGGRRADKGARRSEEHSQRSEDEAEWEEFERSQNAATGDEDSSTIDRIAGAAQPAKVVGAALGASDAAVTKKQQEAADGSMRRSKSHQEPANSIGGISSSSSSSNNPAASPQRRGDRKAVQSMTSMSLEQARSRAQAGLRQQESREAPQLARFHDPQKPLQPRIRRSTSNAAVNELLQSYNASQGGQSGLHTRVFTPDDK